MLDFILQAIMIIKQVGYWGLVLSYKTGQLIIRTTEILIELLVHTNKTVGAVLRVLFEDFHVFLSDLGQRLLHILNIIYNVYQGLVSCIVGVFETIVFVYRSFLFVVTQLSNAIFGIVTKVILGIGQTVVVVKYLVLLLGSGIWFAVTLIPILIVYTCTMLTYYVGRLTDEFLNITSNSIKQSKLFLSALYEFVTDVPFESLAGLIAGACIIYMVVKFQLLLYQKLLSAVELIRQSWQRMRLRLRMRNQGRIWVQNSTSESDETDGSSEGTDEPESSECNEDRVCIVCKERNKCILILPCRHVCLCCECNTRLRNYNRTCPICRTVIQKTMKVFV